MFPPSTPGSDIPVPRRRRALRKLSRFALGLVLLLWGVLLAAWLALHWIILPHIDEWRPAIERRLSQSLGAPVRIGEIRVVSSGWVPALSLRELRVLDPDGGEALRVAHVATALSVPSALAGRLRFDQILIDGAQLALRRDVAGRWYLGGLALDGNAPADDSPLRDWLFEQHELVIRNSGVRVIDERPGAVPLQLEQVDLVLRNGRLRHALRFDATPPSAWGARLSVRGEFTQPLLSRPGDFQRWSGTVFAETARADAVAVARALGLSLPLREAQGALRAWLDIRQGFARSATLDVAVPQLTWDGDGDGDAQPLELGALVGRLDARRDGHGVNLHWQQAGDRPNALNAGELALSWRQEQPAQALLTSGQPVDGGTFSADRLDLATLADAVAQLPAAAASRALLKALSPAGQISGLKARWTGAPRAPSSYRLDADVAGLSLRAAATPNVDAAGQAHPARPGVRGASVHFSATQDGGQAMVQVRNGALVFPGVWAEPSMPINALDATLRWQVVARDDLPPRIDLQLTQARFDNADMAGEFSAKWTTGEGARRFPGTLDFSGKLSRGRPERVWRYLPLGIAAVARDYVQQSIRGGAPASAQFKVQGDLGDFPFAPGSAGVFQVVVQARELDLAYLPETLNPTATWPAFGQVSGELIFDAHAMRIRAARARLWGVQISDVNGGIADLAAERPVLSLQGSASGPVADLLRYLRATPLGPWIGPALQPLAASGAADLRLALQLPLDHPEQSTVAGSVSFDGNDVRLRSDLPALSQARGRIDFTQNSFRLQPTTARLLGNELSVEGGTAADGALRFNATGVAAIAVLRERPELAGRASALLQRLSGKAAYRATLNVIDGVPSMSLSSDLVGLAIDLPAPLGKSAETPWPSRLQLAPTADASAPNGPPRNSLRLQLGPVLRAAYVLDTSAETVRVLRGGIGVFDDAPTPASGVAARLKLGVVDIDAWSALLDGTDAPDGAAGAAEGAVSAYVPQSLQLRAEELRAGARHVTNLQATLSRERGERETLWRAQLSADQLSGTIDYRQPLAAGVPGGVRARLQRLSLPPSDVSGVEDLLSRPPASVPALDVVADEFELRGKKLGRLEVQARNTSEAGGTALWHLDTLQLRMPEATFNASGRWSVGGERRMALDFDLNLADGGAFAARLGAVGALRGGKGRVDGSLSWAGSPLSLDYPSLQGHLSVALQAGQLLQAEPGASRLLGVFSLQALPRRLLSFDFRDLFDKGFAFDTVNGDLDIAAGVAHTDNLRMLGVQAAVLMQGSADLNHETQDLQVLIVPNIDASGAALATAAISPLIGLGAMLAQWALSEPLRAAGTRQYHITGGWADPQVEAVERDIDSPLPTIEPAPPGASSPKAKP